MDALPPKKPNEGQARRDAAHPDPIGVLGKRKVDVENDTPTSKIAKAGKEYSLHPPKGLSLRKGEQTNLPSNTGKVKGYESWSEHDYNALLKTFCKKDIEENSPQELFFKCIERNEEHALSGFINDKNFNINVVGASRESALHRAVVSRSITIIKKLLNREDLDLNAKDKNGTTPLHLAVRINHPPIVELLLRQEGIQRNEPCNMGITPSLYALEGELHETLGLFTEKEIHEAKKASIKKTIANFFNLRSLHGEYIKIESSRSNQIYLHLSKHLLALMEYPLKGPLKNTSLDDLEDYFVPLIQDWIDIKSATPRSTFSKIKDGAPISIPAGLPARPGQSGHYISVSINKDWVALGNRGELIDPSPEMAHLNASGMYFYHIPDLKKQFDEAFISRLLKKDPKALQEIQSTHTQKIFYIPRLEQKRGNCGYANGKLDVLAHILFFVLQQKNITLEEISDHDDPRWVDALQEAKVIYRDFAIFGRVQLFNTFMEDYFDETNSDDIQICSFMHKEIERLASKGPTGESGCFQAISVRNSAGNEIPIMDQLNPGGIAVVKKYASDY